MVYKSSRLAERVPAEATEASRVGRRRTREAVLLVGVPRSVVDGDLFAGFDEAFEVEIGLQVAVSSQRLPRLIRSMAWSWNPRSPSSG